jgi:hypothetical protein
MLLLCGRDTSSGIATGPPHHTRSDVGRDPATLPHVTMPGSSTSPREDAMGSKLRVIAGRYGLAASANRAWSNASCEADTCRS